MGAVQTAHTLGQHTPIGAVVVHFDLLPNDPLLFGNGLLGEIGFSHHAQQHIQAFVDLRGRRKNIAGFFKAGKGIRLCAGFGIQRKRIALIAFKHFMLQKMRRAFRNHHFFAVHGKEAVNRAKIRAVHRVYRAVARHGAHLHGEPAGQGDDLVFSGLYRHLVGFHCASSFAVTR